MQSFDSHPTVHAIRRQPSPSMPSRIDGRMLRQWCLDAGADDAGLVGIDRSELDDDRADILRIFPATRSLIFYVIRMNADSFRSPVQGTPWAAHYSATKAYVQVFAEGLGRELRTDGVDILSVAPGPTSSGFASRAKMKNGKSMDPNRIAPEILNSLGRKSTVLPGFLSKLLVYSMLPLPRWARVAIMGKVMRGMAST